MTPIAAIFTEEDEIEAQLPQGKCAAAISNGCSSLEYRDDTVLIFG